MIRPRHVLLAGAGLWVGYAWGAHLATPLCVWRGPRARRAIALTFDDGPDAWWTPRIADLLAQHQARGTFFMVGERAARAPEAVRAVIGAGHDVENHSWSHRSLWFCRPRRTDEEIGRTQTLLGDLTGQRPRYFRPPWGMVNAALFASLRRHGLRCVFWSIQPEARRSRDGRAQVRHVLARLHPGAIVDLHDAAGVPGAPERLAGALPTLIARLREAGYALVTLRALLAERQEEPFREP